jgi:hypothetical protein
MTAASTAARTAALYREGPRAAITERARRPQWAAVGRSAISAGTVPMVRILRPAADTGHCLRRPGSFTINATARFTSSWTPKRTTVN